MKYLFEVSETPSALSNTMLKYPKACLLSKMYFEIKAHSFENCHSKYRNIFVSDFCENGHFRARACGGRICCVSALCEHLHAHQTPCTASAIILIPACRT